MRDFLNAIHAFQHENVGHEKHVPDLPGCFVSVATFWEMAIKTSIGKLEMKMPFTQLKGLITENGIEILPIDIEHTLLIAELPFYHKDPFDRLLIAQAINENMTLLSRDEKFLLYAIKTLW